MQTLGNLWPLWLVLLVVFGGISLALQAKKAKKTFTQVGNFGAGFMRPRESDGEEHPAMPNFGEVANGMTEGMGAIAGTAFAAAISALLLVIAVLFNIFGH